VRQARDEVASYAEGLGLATPGVDDLKTIVSEACSNIVRHAYPDEATDRPMEVEMKTTDDELTLGPVSGLPPALAPAASGSGSS
jgi:anti-sigma regulatory factor (Ser/Thr protein kinase)